MKRIIMIIAAFALLPLASDAQVVIRKTQDKNMSSVSATVVKKNVVYKERKLYDAKVGFQQFVELSPKTTIVGDCGHTGINYIGGWRFNNWIYAGVGTGLEFAHNFAKGAKDFIGSDIVTYSKYGDRYYDISEEIDADINGSFNRVSIPLYLHLRAYYMRTKWAPYSSVSFGGRLAPKDSGVYFDFSTGVDWRINDDYHAYFSLGLWLSKFRKASIYNYELERDWYSDDENCGTRACPYYNSEESHSHNKFYNLFCEKVIYGGTSFRLGISF